jgi:regulator of sirC expression with transglutaminase-like and TPR domain
MTRPADDARAPSDPPDDLERERVAFMPDDASFDLFRAAALMGRVEGRDVDVDGLMRDVGALAVRVKERLSLDARWPEPLSALLEVLFVEDGFVGETVEYDDPNNSFLDVVVKRRRGLPIALSLLVCEVARRVGIQAHGIAFPGHFLVGVPADLEGEPELVVVDPFHGGRLLSPDALEEQLFRLTGQRLELTAEHLRPAAPAAVLVRMLQNLRGSYLRRQDAPCLLRVLSRLLLLRPNDAMLFAERAQLRREELDREGARLDCEAAVRLAGRGPAVAIAERVLEQLDGDARWVC